MKRGGWRNQFLFGSKAKPVKRRIAQPYGTRTGDWPNADDILVKEFDELTDIEAEGLSKSVGVSGARRPPSE